MGKNGWLDGQVAERRKGKNTLNRPLILQLGSGKPFGSLTLHLQLF